MTLASIAWRYLWSRRLVTAATLAGIALGAALISGVLTLRRESERTFLNDAGLFDLVVGAKGSPLQLVLSSVYHLDTPTGNVPYAQFEALRDSEDVRFAVPLGLGDNHRGFRIVGTEPQFFALERRGEHGFERYVRIAEGTEFAAPFEAVLGAAAARVLRLRVGDTFVGTHGLIAAPGSEEHREFPYTVVGILAPTGGSLDRAIYTPLESVWQVHDREAQIHNAIKSGAIDGEYEDPPPGFEEVSEDEATSDTMTGMFARAQRSRGREVTAILVQLQTPGLRRWVADDIAQTTNAMPAIPIDELLRLYGQVLGPMQRTLLAVAYLSVVVSGLTVLATLYQAAERRRRDIAVLRALGAHRWEVFALVLLEALLVTALGIGAGWALGHGALAAGAAMLERDTGFAIAAWSQSPEELAALAIVAAMGLLAGLIPAMASYRRPPVEDLAAAA